MRKLVSMVDFVLEQESNFPCSDKNDYIETNEKVLKSIIKHANFLKQPLTLSMFIPTDENGNVLEELYKQKCNNCTSQIGYDCCNDIEYQQAKSKVIFEGFCYFEHQSTFVNSRNNNFEYCVFNYTKDKLGICTYTENKGFHTYFKMSTIEDLVSIEKGITLTDKI